MDLNQLAFQYFEGVDLMVIEGVNESTIMTIISELGLEDIKKFESAKQFTSWLRLAPNNKNKWRKSIVPSFAQRK